MESNSCYYPDIETASEEYASRFGGAVGEFLLERQRETVLSLIESAPKNSKVLEVGGGHGQLTRAWIENGHEVWVQGSSEKAFTCLDKAWETFDNSRCHKVVSSYYHLPFPDKSFDIVSSVRLLSHVDDWQVLIKEMCRVSRGAVIIDYPPKASFNLFYPLLFKLKKRVEGNTRPYLRFQKDEIVNCFDNAQFRLVKKRAEFFVPMVVHRWLKRPKISSAVEKACLSLGLTNVFGSPIVVVAADLTEYGRFFFQ